MRRGISGHLTIWRYLHDGLVPAPAVVAGFAVALAAGEDVGRPIPAVLGGRRRSVLAQLARFRGPEPW